MAVSRNPAFPVVIDEELISEWEVFILPMSQVGNEGKYSKDMNTQPSTWHNFRDQKQRTRLEWELTLA